MSTAPSEPRQYVTSSSPNHRGGRQGGGLPLLMSGPTPIAGPVKSCCAMSDQLTVLRNRANQCWDTEKLSTAIDAITKGI